MPEQRIVLIPGVVIRALARDDAAALRSIRLEGLRLHPEAFASSVAEEERQTEMEFAERIPESAPDVIFGAFRTEAPASPALAGILGFHVETHEKERHKARLWGMYVRSEYRRLGVGAALLNRAIAHARHTPGIEVVQLAVAVGMQSARRLYGAAGFVTYGVERRGLKLQTGQYLDEELMALDLRPAR